MKSFKEFLEEKDDVMDDIGYHKATPDYINGANKLAAELSSNKTTSTDDSKKLSNVKANRRRWVRQYYSHQTPQKARELEQKIKDADNYIRTHEK